MPFLKAGCSKWKHCSWKRENEGAVGALSGILKVVGCTSNDAGCT